MQSTRLVAPGQDLLAHAADIALDAVAGPDLSRLTVLVPTPHLAAPFRLALGAAAAARGMATVLPPRVATLDALVEHAADGRAVMPRARRLAELQRILAVRGWFGGAPPWDTCRAILALADELSSRLPEPPGEAGFLRLIEAHYRGRGSRVAEPEAKLVYEVWRAFARPVRGAALDPGLSRRMLLGEAARVVAGPVIWIGARTGACAGVEDDAFLDVVGARHPVARVAPAALLPALEAAWPSPIDAPLALRGATLAAHDHEPLGRIRIHKAATLEAEARAATRQVHAWLAQGRRAIALIAVDRVVARRVRALLERDAVLLADEAGWKLSTTSAATCAMRWIDVVSGGFHQRDLLDWMRSPFVFADLGRGVRTRAAAAIEAAVRRHNVQGGLAAIVHALGRDAAPDEAALAMLARIEGASRPWSRRAATLGEWFDLLQASLDALGCTVALAADAAGILLLELVRTLRDQLAEGALQTLGAWREFFAAELESASFRDSAIDSPVVMTSMERAQLRRFEAVLLLGAGEAHLGAEREPGPLLAAQLRAQLQLETPRERQDRLRDTLGMLIAHAQEFHATWLAGSADEPQPLSPWLVRVDVLARAAGQPGLVLQEAPEPPWQGTVAPAVAPAPAAPGLRPPTLSVSAYGSLIACPYQFFARHLLGLNEADEVREEFEKSDYGQWVHDLLNRLHARFPRFTGLAHDVLRTTFERIADDVFAPAIEFNFLSLGWKQRWVALADAYIAWQLEREAAGWLWQAGEVAAEMPFVLADGAGVSLRGRLDRIDRGRDGALEILDYKTQDLVALRRKVAEPGEDVQLAAYRLLHPHGEAATAAYVAVDGKRIGTVPANQAHDPAAEGRRLVALVGAIDAGAGLPANAPDPACSWCEMRGLCRRDHWRAEGRGDA